MITLELTPAEEAQVETIARQVGLAPDEYVKQLVKEHLPTVAEPSSPKISAKNAAAVAQLQAWKREDATDDPEAIRKAEADIEELMRKPESESDRKRGTAPVSMSLHILLDSHPLGLVSNPVRSPEAIAITDWTSACLTAGHEIYIPEVIDYELRRELLRASKTPSVGKLDNLKAILTFLPINSPAMLLAADLWAMSRQSGFSTVDPKKLDVDVILAAQALTLGVLTNDLIVATSNVGHLARFVSADAWTNIAP